jgi:hypothetical protein
MGANAASNAADQQAAASQQANALNREQFEYQKKMGEQARADLDPWKQSGMTALSGLADKDFQRDFGANDFQQDPGYQFRMAEGQKALERSAAARGGLQSGGFAKALTKYGQGVASEEYNNAYNRFNADRDRRFSRLSSLSGAGQSAAAGMGANSMAMGQAGMNYAGQVGNNMMNNANAQGAAGIAGANAWGQGLSGVAKAGMDSNAMAQQGKWMEQYFAGQNKTKPIATIADMNKPSYGWG